MLLLSGLVEKVSTVDVEKVGAQLARFAFQQLLLAGQVWPQRFRYRYATVQQLQLLAERNNHARHCACRAVNGVAKSAKGKLSLNSDNKKTDHPTEYRC